MSITYDDLRDIIGDQLGYGVSSASWSANSDKTTRIERCLEGGLRRFYNPEAPHQWSFLFPVKDMQFEAGVYRYVLPADFAMLQTGHCPTYAPGDDSIWPPLAVTGAEVLWYRLQMDTASGRPRECAVQLATVSESVGTRYELLVYPVPDDAYVIKLPYQINPTIPGHDESVPLGGQPHEQTLIEACRAEAEAFDEFSDGRYEQRFMQRLQASIAHDQLVTMPFRLGQNIDRSDRYNTMNEADARAYMTSLSVTYNGSVPD